jgi:hypothetical protein
MPTPDPSGGQHLVLVRHGETRGPEAGGTHSFDDGTDDAHRAAIA